MTKANSVKGRVPLYHIQGIPIYEKNHVQISFHHTRYDPLIRAALENNLSITALIRMMMAPCKKCGHDKIEVHLLPEAKVGKGPCITHFHKSPDLTDGEAAECDPHA